MTLDARTPPPPQPGRGHDNAAQAALEASRLRVEEGLGALRQAIEGSPAGRFAGTWTLPLLAAAVGLSLALLLRRRIRDNRELEEDDW
jgi:hypothetical protein